MLNNNNKTMKNKIKETYYTLEELEAHKGKYFIGGVERDGSICDISEITKDWYYELLKDDDKDWDTSWEITDEGKMRYMYYDGTFLVYVFKTFRG